MKAYPTKNNLTAAFISQLPAPTVANIPENGLEAYYHHTLDLNQVLLDAWWDETGEECNIDPANEELMQLLSGVYDQARSLGFDASKVRKRMDGVSQYIATVDLRGVKLTGEFSDWFKDDAEATACYIEILAEQGYTIERVEIGNPCNIYIS